MKITIEDIARKAGVSTATVSRVLNNIDHPVSSKTRARVLSVARSHNYATNIYAKGLAGQSNVIGLCIGAPLSVDPGFSLSVAKAIDGLKEVTRKHNYHVFLEIEDYAQRNKLHRGFFAGVPLAGVILIAPRRDNLMIPYLHKQGVPFVILGSREFSDCNCVDGDNAYAGREAVRHLFALKRRKIAWLGGPNDFAPSVDMEAGFRAKLKQIGLKCPTHWSAHPPLTMEGGRLAALAMLRHADPPDSIFCFTDFLAVGAVLATQALGFRVPHDVAIVGYDDFPIGQAIQPQLTTFRHPDHEIASTAARCLIEDLIPRKTNAVVCQQSSRPSL
jgi:LacI family transcriptional regulator